MATKIAKKTAVDGDEVINVVFLSSWIGPVILVLDVFSDLPWEGSNPLFGIGSGSRARDILEMPGAKKIAEAYLPQRWNEKKMKTLSDCHRPDWEHDAVGLEILVFTLVDMAKVTV
ncbi:hypothetical protein RRG08_047111 [Elysia crispata]|uniref:Uncharacterized protein n=1 Tax=Elysia crispata TaxID=231223 RepID=A0AAE1E373_9GAST|nr:hypothetical protein RRG08_047111 [Elysia crispata]